MMKPNWDDAPVEATHWCESKLEWRDETEDTISDCCIRIPDCEPAAPEWDGEGLPPVGTIVEYASSDELGDAGAERWKEGDEIEILAHKTCGAEDVAVVWNITVQEASQRLAEWKGKAVFRPLRTKEQREREELAAIIKAEGVTDEVDAFQVALAILAKYELKDRNND